MHRYVAFLFVAAMSNSTAALAVDAAQVLQPNFWASFDWSAVEKSTLWNDKNLGEQTGEPGDVRRRAQTIFNGRPVTFVTHSHAGSKSPRFTFTFASSNDCDALANDLKISFGDPLVVADESYDFFGTIQTDTYWYWKVGETAVVHRCRSVPGEMLVFVDFYKASSFRTPTALVHLKCTQNMVFNDGSSAPMEDALWTFLPYSQAILNERRMPLSLDPKVSETTIEFSAGAKDKGKFTYRIDRTDGQLDGSFVTPDGKRTGIKGACVKRELTRKF